jgi:hypothetical protein
MKDFTSNANDGTGTNTPTATTGKIPDGAVSLVKASNQYINFGNSNSMAPIGITFGAWVKATSLASATYNTVLNRREIDGHYWGLYIATDNRLAPYLYTNSGYRSYDGSGLTTLSLNTWYHLMITYDSATGLIGYVNGVLDGTASSGGDLTTNTGNTYAGFDNLGSGNWDGLLDQVEISNIVRSANWIATQYANQNSIPTIGAFTPNSTAYTKNVSDTYTLSDAISRRAITRSLSETITLVEGVAKRTGRSVADIFTCTDLISRRTGKSFLDTLILVENLALRGPLPIDISYFRNALGDISPAVEEGSATEEVVDYDNLDYLKGYL